MTVSKFFIIILSFILIYNTAVAVPEAGFLRTPSNGTYELNKTIEKLIASNEESSQKIEEMTSEIQSLTERLVVLTGVVVVLTSVLVAITLLPFIIRFFKWVGTARDKIQLEKMRKKPTLIIECEKNDFT